MRGLGILATVVLMVGCRTPLVYEKPGSTEDDFHRDNGACQAYATAAGVPYQGRNIYDACMRGKGWYRAAKK